MERDIQIKEIAKLFLKLGFIGFGGPAAHIAMMQQEVVVKKKWMSEQHFLDLLGDNFFWPVVNKYSLLSLERGPQVFSGLAGQSEVHGNIHVREWRRSCENLRGRLHCQGERRDNDQPWQHCGKYVRIR
jgi:hypothetical protein